MFGGQHHLGICCTGIMVEMNINKALIVFVCALVTPLFVSAQGVVSANSLGSVFSASVGDVSLTPTNGGEYQVSFSLSGTKGFSSPVSYTLSLKQKYTAATYAYYGSPAGKEEVSINLRTTAFFC